MRDNLKQVGTTENAFPRQWMRTAPQEVLHLDLASAIPCAFVNPNRFKDVLLRIQMQILNLTHPNFDVDRYIIDSTTGNSNESYIVFQNYEYNV